MKMTTKMEYINKLWSDKATVIQQKPITLKSGRKSHVYINHRHFVCLPENRNLILALFQNAINNLGKNPIALCNVTSSVSPFLMGALSERMQLPCYSFRAGGGEKGIVQDIFAYSFNDSSTYPKGLPAILIDDVVTTTATLNSTALSLKQSGIDIIGCVVLVDRRLSSEKMDTPVKIFSIVTLSEILEYVINEAKNLDEKDKKLVADELKYLEF